MLMRSPTSAFSSVDLPTDGRPTIATWPQRKPSPRSSATHSPRDDLRMGARRRFLLRGAAARTAALRDDSDRGNPAFDGERLRMRLPRRADDCVLGHRQLACLKPFLQLRLRILAERFRIDVAQQVAERPLDEGPRGAEA